MRVAFNISCLYTPEGQAVKLSGVHQYADSLLGALFDLAAAGETPHEICAFAPLGVQEMLVGNGAREFNWWQEGRSACLDTAGSRREWQPSTKKSPVYALSRKVRWSLRNRLGLVQARSALQKRYDLLHLCAPSYLPLESLAPRRSVVTLHDMTTRTHAWAHDAANIAAWETLFHWAQKRADHIFTASKASQSEIVEQLKVSPDRVSVVPYAPRAHTQETPPGEHRSSLLCPLGLTDAGGAEARFVLYAGNLEPRKNLEKLIRAFALLIRESPNATHDVVLVLAGGAWKDQQKRLQTVAEDEGIGARVLMTGYISEETLNALMSACEVFAYVSLAEGFGLPPLEAMACGAPVVASNISSLPEVVGKAGLQVNPHCCEEIASALHLLLTDAGENTRRRVLSRQQATDFTWQRSARCVLNVYDTLDRRSE